MFYNRGKVKRETDLIIVEEAEIAAEKARLEAEEEAELQERMDDDMDFMTEEDMDTAFDALDRAMGLRTHERDEEAESFNESHIRDDYHWDYFDGFEW